MTDKVKMSMFLPKAIAHAVKIQAARQGSGVSELVGRMFLCAHCREPITDEFVVGKPKLIEPNRFAVLFHKNREACLAASGTRMAFGAECPECGALPMQSFDRLELPALLQMKAVKFYCIQCDHHWKATPKDAKQIARLLA